MNATCLARARSRVSTITSVARSPLSNDRLIAAHGWPGFTFYATPSATYRSKVFFELPNRAEISQDGYTLVNLRAGLEFGEQGCFRAGGFARNLTNEKFLIDAGNTGGGFGVPTYIAGEPRFYGVELGARF